MRQKDCVIGCSAASVNGGTVVLIRDRAIDLASIENIVEKV